MKNTICFLFCILVYLGCTTSTSPKEETKTDIQPSRSMPQKGGKSISVIRKNFQKINAIEKWTRIEEKELWDSAEGGIAKLHYQGDSLRKITADHFGESGKLLNEYYLLNGELSFVFERVYQYNRPIYWDSLTMKEMNDDQVFDLDKSEITERRCYFESGKLIRYLDSKEKGKVFSDDFLIKEQNSLLETFEKFLKEK